MILSVHVRVRVRARVRERTIEVILSVQVLCLDLIWSTAGTPGYVAPEVIVPIRASSFQVPKLVG